ncbi:MAG: cytochrome-c oxidase, cbb3-type subunit II [Caulobacter sp.]|nr:cytochrome-c oxidase, cbb3-type subunit II [Caulobacter sp.]
MSIWKHHGKFERHSLALVIGILLVVSVGGLVEIAPLFWLESTIEKVKGVRPYTPLEQTGRDIYVREGCYVCHSQMIRPLRDEVERYGPYSLAAESMYDHPFQWGSKRTGPDLARVGGKYSDSWHRDHLIDPRSVVPESVMPPYAFMADKDLSLRDVQDRMRALTAVGVPYTQDQIDSARADMEAQADPFSADGPALRKRYGEKVVSRDFDGDPERLTELDALIAYLQMLGTLVDFSTYQAAAPANER